MNGITLEKTRCADFAAYYLSPTGILCLFGENKSNQQIAYVFLIQSICGIEKLTSEMILNERK